MTMGSFGHLALIVAAVAAALSGAASLASSTKPHLTAAARHLAMAASLAAVVAVLSLVFILVTHDYRFGYVRDYADRTMTVVYLLTAVWGGQEGSLLVWAALQVGLVGLMGRWFASRPEYKTLEPVTMGILSALGSVFCLLVLFHADPFETLGTEASRGIGINPLLRNPYMAVHPPTLYLGFVGLAVPFALAMAALAEGGLQRLCAKAARSWTLVAWLFLSAGNLLGMVWAYEELGWGGYWGWDPVENASFMPWLTATALLHTFIVQSRFGGLKLWSTFLSTTSFALVIFGTFLTRSGVIQSVHAFAGATSGPYLLGLIAVIVGLAIGLAIWRRRDFVSEVTEASGTTRLAFISWTAWVLTLSTVFVWLATTSPLWAEALRGEKVVMTPEFYNRWMVPLGLVILALIGVCLVLGWAKAQAAVVMRRVALPSLAAVGAVVVGLLAGAIRQEAQGLMRYAAVAALAVIAFSLAAVASELYSLTRKSGKVSPGQRRRLGAHLVHLSIVVLFIGFLGAGFEKEASRSLLPGQTLSVGDYRLTHLGLRADNNFEREAMLVDLDVRRGSDSLGVMSPGRYFYHSHPNQPTSEVVIRTSLAEDLFLILGDVDPNTSRASIRAVINPLVIWLWIGGVVMLLGTAVSMWPDRRAAESISQDLLWTAGLWALCGCTASIAAGVLFGLHVGVLTALTVCLIGFIVALGRTALDLSQLEVRA